MCGFSCQQSMKVRLQYVEMFYHIMIQQLHVEHEYERSLFSASFPSLLIFFQPATLLSLNQGYELRSS